MRDRIVQFVVLILVMSALVSTGCLDDEDSFYDDDSDDILDKSEESFLDGPGGGGPGDIPDNDGDGISDEDDPDDDNDGFNDTIDVDPLNDLAISFSFLWVNVTQPLNTKNRGWIYFEIFQNDSRIHSVDDNGRPWRVYWEEQTDIPAQFELNVPDNRSLHHFSIRGFHARSGEDRLLDLNGTNGSFMANISYKIAGDGNGSTNHSMTYIFDGTLDNGTDEPDSQLSLTLETFNFGYRISYSWTSHGDEYQLTYSFDPTLYIQYKNADHTIKRYDDYIDYATPDDETLINFTSQLHNLTNEKNLSQLEEAQFLLDFVQSLKYTQDNVTTGIGEYPRYPLETLVDQSGDCEDTAILVASMAEILGIESILILIPDATDDSGHAAAGFAVNATGSFYTVDDIDFYYGETTATGWEIGEIPDFESSEAYLYELL